MTKPVLAYANKTYEAERGYWASLPADHAALRQVTVGGAQEVVDRHVVGWTVVRGRGFKSGLCSPSTSRIVIGGMAGLWIVLHELAHANTPQGAPMAHDPTFRSRYVTLVRAEVGDAEADGLLGAFLGLGLRVG
jgi:hypothetical protein